MPFYFYLALLLSIGFREVDPTYWRRGMLYLIYRLGDLHHPHEQLLRIVRPPLIRVCRCEVHHARQRVEMLRSEHLLRNTITCTSSCSASPRRPWFEYVDARLVLLLKVSKFSTPKISCRILFEHLHISSDSLINHTALA